MTIADLLTAVAAAPRLSGAACRATPRLFDSDASPSRRARAIEICTEQCPALNACRQWLDSLPIDQRPAGTVAGRYIRPPTTVNPTMAGPRARYRAHAVDAAIDWLQCHLAGRGMVASADVRRDAAAAGIRRTVLYTAAQRLGVVVETSGKLSFWTLPAAKGFTTVTKPAPIPPGATIITPKTVQLMH